MQYPQDGGVSAIRWALGERSHPLARVAAKAITVAHHDAGELLCQCGWPGGWHVSASARWAVLCCSWNGSSLPLGVGPSCSMPEDRTAVRCSGCGQNGRYAAAVAIGYPVPTPPLGSLEAERAQEIALAVRCTVCRTERVAWHLRLPEPFQANAGDPWLRAIQGQFR